MALTKTTLGAACTADDLRLKVAASAGAAPNCLVQIGDEFAVCTGVVDGTTINVRSRGSQGGRAKPHAILAPVTFGLGADFADTPAGMTAVTNPDWDVREVGVDQGFDPGAAGLNIKTNTEVLITKATALAQTVTPPSQGADGVEVRFLSTNAALHVLTFTPVAGAMTTATFKAGGSSVTIRAQNGVWQVVSNGNATIA